MGFLYASAGTKTTPGLDKQFVHLMYLSHDPFETRVFFLR